MSSSTGPAKRARSEEPPSTSTKRVRADDAPSVEPAALPNALGIIDVSSPISTSRNVVAFLENIDAVVAKLVAESKRCSSATVARADEGRLA